MKKIMIILIIWGSSQVIFAQETTPTATGTSSGKYELNTLFGGNKAKCKIPIGYFIELNGGYTHFGHEGVFLPGISMGAILNHHWTVGLTGNFINNHQQSNHHRPVSDTLGEERHRGGLSGGYGGLLLEYTLFPQSKIHVSFPLMIGGGYISHSQWHLNDSINSQPETSNGHFSHGDHFFVIEPGVKLEFNVVKHMRVGFGISYRYSPERDHRISSPEFQNQLTGKLSLRFGKF